MTAVRRMAAVATALVAVSGLTLASGGTPLDRAHELVQELRGMPTPLPPAPPSRGVDPVEERRREVYRQLRQLEDAAVWALASALSDPDVRMRRNATLALGFLAGGYFVRSRPGLDIRDALPPLIDALQDDPAGSLATAVEWTTAQCVELLRNGAPGIHFYTLNQSPATRAIFQNLRSQGLIG